YGSTAPDGCCLPTIHPCSDEMARGCDTWPAHGPSQALLAAVRVSTSPLATPIAASQTLFTLPRLSTRHPSIAAITTICWATTSSGSAGTTVVSISPASTRSTTAATPAGRRRTRAGSRRARPRDPVSVRPIHRNDQRCGVAHGTLPETAVLTV